MGNCYACARPRQISASGKDVELQPLVKELSSELPEDTIQDSGESNPPKQDRPPCLKCCCGCCCCVLVTIVVFSLIVIYKCTFEVYGTTFTFGNYMLPNVKYLVAGMADNSSLTEFYNDIATRDNPLIALFPGPNTKMYYGWHDVKAILTDFGPRIRNGTMKRYNELGITIQNSEMWPAVGTIALGLSNSKHALVRPFLGKSLDGAKGREDEDCDGSTCWNAKWLHRIFREHFASESSVSSTDLKWIITKVLHKVHLNLDISDADAKEFASFMTNFILPQPIPPALAAWWPVQGVIGVLGILETKAKLMQNIKKAVMKKWPDEDWSTERLGNLDYVASGIMDSLALAGGLSVPTVLDYMVALLFMKDSPVETMSVADLAHTSKLHDFMLETVRRFPPVAAVPRWITDDDGKTWKHQLPNVGQALQDPALFPKPLDMILGRPGLNSRDSNLSIGWADFALVNNDVSDGDSHSCPGKSLSIQVMAAFLQEFAAAGPWVAESDDITLTMYSTSGWSVKKVAM